MQRSQRVRKTTRSGLHQSQLTPISSTHGLSIHSDDTTSDAATDHPFTSEGGAYHYSVESEFLATLDDEDQDSFLPDYPHDTTDMHVVEMPSSPEQGSPGSPFSPSDVAYKCSSPRKVTKSPRRKEIEAKARDKMRIASRRLRDIVGPRCDGGAFRGTADVMERAAELLEKNQYHISFLTSQMQELRDRVQRESPGMIPLRY